MSILRMPGPKTRYEVAAVAIAEPPKIVEPPVKPEEVAAAGSEHDAAPTTERSSSTILETGDDRSEPDIGSDTIGPPGIPGGPPGGGAACLGGVCGKGPIGIPGGGGSCIGPQCKQVKMKPSALEPVPVSSLGCIACADPDVDALRRTAAGSRKSGGTNVTRFCVDSTGHVEAGSVETETSHGDPAIDRVCRDAVKRWRFSPAKVSGQGRRACSEAAFRIDFE
jgi:TonB family protein